MAGLELRVEGKVAWTLDYYLPALWSWLFDARSITESRRLHTTAFDAAARFQECRERLRPLPYFHEIASVFERLTPEYFPRDLGVPPDAVMSLDLEDFENRRPYVHERGTERWEQFFAAVNRGDQPRALELWEAATLNPLAFYGSQQSDARALAARALELGIGREERARALVTFLFGKPANRRAEALTHRWLEEAGKLPAVAWREKRRWWAALFSSRRDG